MTKAKVADYICLSPETEVTLAPSQDAEFEFEPPSNASVDHFFRSPILMFRVRSAAVTSGGRLTVELNGNKQLNKVVIAADAAARSYHEIINREDFNPGDRNVLQFTAEGDNEEPIVISDVIVWFQHIAED